MKGIVKFIKRDKGFGFVLGEDGKDYFLRTAMFRGMKLPGKNAELEFEFKMLDEDLPAKTDPESLNPADAADAAADNPEMSAETLREITDSEGGESESADPKSDPDLTGDAEISSAPQTQGEKHATITSFTVISDPEPLPQKNNQKKHGAKQNKGEHRGHQDKNAKNANKNGGNAAGRAQGGKDASKNSTVRCPHCHGNVKPKALIAGGETINYYCPNCQGLFGLNVFKKNSGQKGQKKGQSRHNGNVSGNFGFEGNAMTTFPQIYEED